MSRTEKLRKEFSSSVRRNFIKDTNKSTICHKCGSHEGKSINIHHVIPLADGGTNDYNNLIPLCNHCHRDWHTIEGLIDFEKWMWYVPRYEDIVRMVKFIEHEEGVDFRNIKVGKNTIGTYIFVINKLRLENNNAL
ncbi:MAG: HNH endonuclease [Bacilli bacterium]